MHWWSFATLQQCWTKQIGVVKLAKIKKRKRHIRPALWVLVTRLHTVSGLWYQITTDDLHAIHTVNILKYFLAQFWMIRFNIKPIEKRSVHFIRELQHTIQDRVYEWNQQIILWRDCHVNLNSITSQGHTFNESQNTLWSKLESRNKYLAVCTMLKCQNKRHQR